MEKSKKSHVRLISIGTVAVLLILMILAIQNIVRYQTYMVDRQKAEFLRLAHAMRFGTEEFHEGERQTLQTLVKDDVFRLDPASEESRQMLADKLVSWMEGHPGTRQAALLIDEDGRILLEAAGSSVSDIQGLSEALAQIVSEKSSVESAGTGDAAGNTGAGKIVIGRAFLAQEHAYLVPMYCWLETDDQGGETSSKSSRALVELCGLEELQEFLNGILEDEDSYVALKTQDGYILSHKNPEQIGLHMVEGRKEKYPDLDFSDYERIMQMQTTGEEATAVYESYWFDREPVVRAKKVASFTPIRLDREFWVLTLNLAYEKYLGPLQQFMWITIALVAAIFLGIALYLFSFMRMRERDERILRENEWLTQMQQTREALRVEREQKIRAMKAAQLGTMTSKIAHEFKNFLMPIIGCAEFIQEDSEAGESAREDAASILDYAEKANQLTKELSRLGRNIAVEHGKEDPQEIDLSKELGDFLKGAERTCPPGIRLEKNVSKDCGVTTGNPSRLQEVFWNLSKNAFDAMKEDGGVLTVEANVIDKTQLPAQAMASLSSRYCRIRFRDTGCGMDEETLGRIFAAYYTTKPAGEGSGLGLSIVYDIVTAMGGDILAASEKGKGTEFTLFLPLA